MYSFGFPYTSHHLNVTIIRCDVADCYNLYLSHRSSVSNSTLRSVPYCHLQWVLCISICMEWEECCSASCDTFYYMPAGWASGVRSEDEFLLQIIVIFYLEVGVGTWSICIFYFSLLFKGWSFFGFVYRVIKNPLSRNFPATKSPWFQWLFFNAMRVLWGLNCACDCIYTVEDLQ